MKKRIRLKKYVIHIFAIPGIDADIFDLPMEQNALIACTRKRSTPYLEGDEILHKLIMEFPDAENPKIPGAFNEAHARVIVRFLEGLPDSVTDLYVCCSKGGSRSAGLAAAFMKGSGRKDKDVWRNPFYVPNTLVYKRMCSELGIFMPWVFVFMKNYTNVRAYRKAQKRGNAGKYERWQILF